MRGQSGFTVCHEGWGFCGCLFALRPFYSLITVDESAHWGTTESVRRESAGVGSCGETEHQQAVELDGL